MSCEARSNAGRILFLSVGLYLSILIGIYGIFGCFEVWASLISSKWPNAAYAGIVILGVFKIIGAFVIIIVFALRAPWLTKLAGWCAAAYVPLSVIWLVVSWIIWSNEKKKGWNPPSWEATFWAFETIFVVASAVLLFWTFTAFFSAARIQKVGGRGFEGRKWRNVIDYMKTRNRREAERLVKAENWLAAEIAFDDKRRQYQKEVKAQQAVKKKEQQEVAKKIQKDRNEEKKQMAAAKKAAATSAATRAPSPVRAKASMTPDEMV